MNDSTGDIVNKIGLTAELSELTDQMLETIYAYPEKLDRPWIQANFVSSLDGAATIGGKSAGLTGPGDQRVFGLQRDISDVVLVGARTASVERYNGIQPSAVSAERRKRLGLSAIPPIAIVTSTASIAIDSPLLTDTYVPPIILTCEAAPQQRRSALASHGADIAVIGDEVVDLPAAIDELARRGLYRIDCEGGPRLFAQLIQLDLIDQLCLTLSPLLTASMTTRITHGSLETLQRRMSLSSLLRDGNFLMLNYRRC